MVRTRRRQAADDHVRVADRFDFFQMMQFGEPVKFGKNLVQHAHQFGRRHMGRQFGKTAQVGEQNRGVGETVGNGALALFEPVGDRLRQYVQQQAFRLFPLRAQLFEVGLFVVAKPFLFQTSVDAGIEQDRIERLGQIILRADFDATHDAILQLVERRKHDDRRITVRLVGLEQFERL